MNAGSEREKGYGERTKADDSVISTAVACAER